MDITIAIQKISKRILPNLRHMRHSRMRRCGACERFTIFVALSPGDELQFCLYCRANLRYEMLAEALRRMDLADMDVLELDPHSPLRLILSGARSYLRTFYSPGIQAGTPGRGGATCQDITQLSLPDRSLDLIVSSDVLEHVPDIGAAFRETARVLRDGGMHIFTVPPRAKTRSREGLPAEFHSDPLDPKGIRVYWDFGLDLPEVIKIPGLAFSILDGPRGHDQRILWAARASSP